MQAQQTQNPTEPRIWEKIRIVVGEGSEAGVYEARVEDVLNGGIVVTDPEFVSGRTLLRNGMTVAVQVTREDAAYQFYATVRLQLTGRVRRVHLSPPRGIKRIQRRRFARIDTSAPARYLQISDGFDWDNWQESDRWQDSYAVNISGGGMLLRIDETTSRGGLLLVDSSLLTEAELDATVVAVCRRIFVDRGQRYGGMEFILVENLGEYLTGRTLAALPQLFASFDRHAQDKLVTHLFHKQIELRQKGLI